MSLWLTRKDENKSGETPDLLLEGNYSPVGQASRLSGGYLQVKNNALNLNSIIAQVNENCDISDSRHAGIYSVCGLALRLRDLYKWETGLDPWEERSSSEILEWIGKKEQKWAELAEKDFGEITIFGNRYDPFDTQVINAVLEPCGLFYGAGYAHSLKPAFFLTPIENKKEIGGHAIYILGRELARDLFTTPALSQEGCVLVRKESAMSFLWDKIHYIKPSGRQALKFALQIYGLSDNQLKILPRHLEAIAAAEIETYIHHELGEIEDTVFDSNLWREIITAFPHTPIELLARTVKDLLADSNEYGTFRHLITERKTASLALYVAFLEAFTKKLFPEITEAFSEFMERGNWNVIEQATLTGYNTAKKYAEAIVNIYQTGKAKNGQEWIQAEISKRLLAPLGV